MLSDAICLHYVTKMKTDTLGAAAQFIKAIAMASVLKILKKVNSRKYNELKQYTYCSTEMT